MFGWLERHESNIFVLKERRWLCWSIQLNTLPPSDAVRQQKKKVFENLFSSVLSQFKKYHPSGNLKFYNLGISKSLKLRIFVKKILLISLKLNFTPNT